VLPSYSPPVSRSAHRQLERLGVHVHTGVRVTGIDDEGVSIGRERVEARTVLWAAGVSASPLGRALEAPVDSAGRVLVTPFLTLPGHDEVYVVGDLAAIRREDGEVVPSVAQAAMQAGCHAAANILRAMRKEAPLPFRYVDKGQMATIGRAAAVAERRGWRFSGLVAWLAWLLVHVVFLVSYRNRFAVLVQWAYHYLTYDRSARLITATAASPSEGAPARADDAGPRGDERPSSRTGTPPRGVAIASASRTAPDGDAFGPRV
jgi:NADH dehydrogenase